MGRAIRFSVIGIVSVIIAACAPTAAPPPTATPTEIPTDTPQSTETVTSTPEPTVTPTEGDQDVGWRAGDVVWSDGDGERISIEMTASMGGVVIREGQRSFSDIGNMWNVAVESFPETTVEGEVWRVLPANMRLNPDGTWEWIYGSEPIAFNPNVPLRIIYARGIRFPQNVGGGQSNGWGVDERTGGVVACISADNTNNDALPGAVRGVIRYMAGAWRGSGNPEWQALQTRLNNAYTGGMEGISYLDAFTVVVGE